MAKLRLLYGAGIDRATGIAQVRPGSMSDLRNVRTIGGKIQARRGTELRSTIPAREDFDLLLGTGAFASGAGWTLGTNWQVTGGTASQTAPSASEIARAVQIVPGYTYKVTFTVSDRTAGDVRVRLGGTNGTLRSTNATFTEDIIAGSGDSLIAGVGDGTWDGKIDNLTVQIADAALVPVDEPGFDATGDWELGLNWQITGGKASLITPGESTSTIGQAVVLEAGRPYNVTYTVSGRTAGSVAVALGGVLGTARTADGTYVEQITPSSPGGVSFSADSPDALFDGEIDDIEIAPAEQNPVSAVRRIQAIQSHQEGVAVAYYSASRQVHVYRIGPTGTDPIHVGLWFTLDVDAASPPRIVAAESYGIALLAHAEIRVGRRAVTQIYDATAGTIEDLEADLAGLGDEPVRFRGVRSWRNYMLGWGFGTSADVRPEIVRISLPGEPIVFLAEHYFIAGDRGSSVTTVREAAAGLIAQKPAESFQIVGESELNFGILPLYALLGCVSDHLSITVEGRCYSWGIRGPWVTTISDEGDLEPPLDLEGPPPSDLPPMGDILDGFAVYLPIENVIEWHFGELIFAMEITEEGVKWTYRTRPFVAGCGDLLYSDGEVLADSPDVSPDGHPEITTVTGTAPRTATLEWDNVTADGDETFEVWLLPDGESVWTQVVPGGIYGGTLVSADLDITLAATQDLPLDELEIGRDYTVAIRYRRGSQYGAGYTSSDPLDWPATARSTFHTDPAAPVLDTAVWMRTSDVLERVRVSFTPATDHETVPHKVYRDGGLVGSLAAGVFVYDDYTIVGETTEAYTVKADAYGNLSPDSNEVEVWAGPAPKHSGVSAVEQPPSGCGAGQAPYNVSWTNGRPDLETEVWADGVLFDTMAPGITARNEVCADETAPLIQVRHWEEAYAVIDYSEYVEATYS